MKNLIDAIHHLLTGVRLSELLDDGYNLGTAGIGDIEGVTVFAGLDSLPVEMPAEKFPYLVLEPDAQDQTYGNQGTELSGINIGFSVLVPGQYGALIGRKDDNSKGILEWMQTVKDLLLTNKKLTLDGTTITTRIDNINTKQFLSGDEQGIIYSRGFEMAVLYRGINWAGQ